MAADATTWQLVDPLSVIEHESPGKHGVTVTMLPSPYDIPDAFRAYPDPETNILWIEFKYASPEPLREVDREHAGLELHVGKKTGRLYRLGIDQNHRHPEAVELVIKTIETLPSRKNQQADENHRITSMLLKSMAPALLGQQGGLTAAAPL